MLQSSIMTEHLQPNQSAEQVVDDTGDRSSHGIKTHVYHVGRVVVCLSNRICSSEQGVLTCDGGSSLHSGEADTEEDSQHFLKEQVKRMSYSEDPKGAVRTVLGVLTHVAPMTLDEIAGLTLDDINWVRRDLEVLIAEGLVAKRQFKDCIAYQMIPPADSTT